MVTLDADFVIATGGGVPEALRASGFVVEASPDSIRAALPGTRLRLRVAMDSHCHDMPSRAVLGVTFGVEMPVACLADVVRVILRAATDPKRRPTERQKDALNIARLAEARPEVFKLVLPGLLSGVDEIRPPV